MMDHISNVRKRIEYLRANCVLVREGATPLTCEVAAVKAISLYDDILRELDAAEQDLVNAAQAAVATASENVQRIDRVMAGLVRQAGGKQKQATGEVAMNECNGQAKPMDMREYIEKAAKLAEEFER